MTHALIRSGLALTSLLLASTALFSTTGRQVAEAAPTPVTSVARQKVVLQADFDGTKRGPVDPASFRKEVGNASKFRGAYAGMTYRKDWRGSGNVVRTELSGGKFIASAGAGRGNVLPFQLPGSYDAACMSYDVRFAAPFDFSAGGKLPGFVGVAPGTSPTTPTGGGSVAHGWSGRLMWLGSKMWKFVRDADRDNMVVTYLYHPGQVRKYGDNVSWGASFGNGRWHTIKQCNTMNTVGKADGVLQTWFDGKLVVDDHAVVYRTDPKVHITHFDWSVFRGGDNASWASQKTGYVDIDNLKITAA